ncbi:hypothetical protein H0H93_015832 [Arthromyces matolae]|nr:hypothetical protein H0H93_015832 [Arthromyces matolae]
MATSNLPPSLSSPISPSILPSKPPLPLIVRLDATDLVPDPLPTPMAFTDIIGPSLRTQVYARYRPYNPQPIIRRNPSSPAAGSTKSNHTVSFTDTTSLDPPSSPRTPLTAVMAKIERPKHAGRLNLQHLLKWDEALFKSCKNRVLTLASQSLDITKCSTDQDAEKMKAVRIEIVKSHPILDEYQDHWPLDIMIMGVLKNTSSTHKRKSEIRSPGQASTSVALAGASLSTRRRRRSQL